ncbi:Heterokaryon incompatibility protein [Neofusicoccum parvum]|uniref:Heterokaryon incompatibility protein n=1 Tax=Neofusicoccum parvum TaxID=310453 RepID=A0ACB5SC12_9PEZI|nr:Heterokaryon incompatibility protein [Neofusicoccum parvum]
MNTDLHRPLQDVRTQSQTGDDLIAQLLHIQEHYLLHNLKSLDWITHLQCLSTADPLARKRKRSRASPDPSTAAPRTLTRATVNGRTGHYIAISYPWTASAQPTTVDRGATGGWRIRAAAGRAHAASAIRDAVLERAARCAAALGCPNVWIDRECIPQDGGPENEVAMHTMDLVYQFSEWPVALLFCPIASKEELAVFNKIMLRRFIAPGEEGGDVLRESVDAEMARGALGVLKGITDDPWWERAWTFQENYCAGPKMNLLIPLRDRGLWRKRQKYEFWRTCDVPGELMVNSVDFHKAATRFCLAYLKSQHVSDADRRICQTILRKAGRYSYTILYDGTVGTTDYSRTMTTRILEDIAHRNAQFREDILPIASNCCQYGVRLDTNGLRKADVSLSASILALYLLNGEIFKNHPHDTPSRPPTVLNFEGKLHTKRDGNTYNRHLRSWAPNYSFKGTRYWQIF